MSVNAFVVGSESSRDEKGGRSGAKSFGTVEGTVTPSAVILLEDETLTPDLKRRPICMVLPPVRTERIDGKVWVIVVRNFFSALAEHGLQLPHITKFVLTCNCTLSALLILMI